MSGPGDAPEVHLSDGWEWVGVGEQVRAGKDYVFSVDGPLPVTTDSISPSSKLYIRRKQPPKPSQEWLDKNGVELTGECRLVNEGDMFFSWDGNEGTDPYIQYLPCTSSSPRWILRKKPAPKVLTFENASVTQTKARRVADGALVLLEFRPDSVCCMNEGCLDFTYGEVCEKYTLHNGRPLTDLIGGDQ